jgi:hypothetical protein
VLFQLTHPTLGTLDLTAANGYVVGQYDLGYPAPRAVTDPYAAADGEVDLTAFHGPRAVTLWITLKGDVETCSVLRDRLWGWMLPGLRPVLMFREPRDGRTRRMKIRAQDASLRVEHPRWNLVQLTWVCADGLIESEEELQIVVRPAATSEPGRPYPLSFDRDYPGSAAGAYYVENLGTTAAHWVAILYGAIENPVITSEGKVLDFRSSGGLNLQPGQLVVLSSQGQTVAFDGDPANSGLQFLDWATSEWFTIAPGRHWLRLDATTYDDNAALVLYYRHTWL